MMSEPSCADIAVAMAAQKRSVNAVIFISYILLLNILLSYAKQISRRNVALPLHSLKIYCLFDSPFIEIVDSLLNFIISIDKRNFYSFAVQEMNILSPPDGRSACAIVIDRKGGDFFQGMLFHQLPT